MKLALALSKGKRMLSIAYDAFQLLRMLSTAYEKELATVALWSYFAVSLFTMTGIRNIDEFFCI